MAAQSAAAKTTASPLAATPGLRRASIVMVVILIS
jgi:hypothetical protein